MSPNVHTLLTLSFNGGMVSGSAGCNILNGLYKIDDQNISIHSVGLTRRFCDPELMAQESTFMSTLETASTWTIHQNQLTLYRKDGQIAISAIRIL